MNVQAIVLRGLLHKDTWFALQTVVTEDVVTNADARKVLGSIRRLHNAIEGDISFTSVRLDIVSTYTRNESLRVSLLETGAEMVSAVLLEKREFDPVVRKYVSREKLMSAAMHLASHMDDVDFDHEKLIMMCESARDTGIGFDPAIDSYKTAGAPDVIKRTGIVATNLSKKLDNALDDGLANGELVVYLAPGGTGKTSAMVKTGCGAARDGLNVLIIGLEINPDRYFGLIDKELTGLRKEDLICSPFLAMAKRKELRGNIWIKDWAGGIDGRKATSSDIRNLLISLHRQEKKVDLLIVDQWELMGSTSRHRDERMNFRDIGVSLRMLANEFDFPVLTGWQTNRAGYKAHIIEEEHIGEDISVKKTSDIIVTLNQNKEERRNKRMRLGLLKQRNSTLYPIVDCYWDIDRMELRDRTDKDIEDNLSIEGVKDEEEQGDVEVSQ